MSNETLNKIPIIDLTLNHQSIKDEIEQAVCEVLRSGKYILGSNVKAFEEELSKYLCVHNAVSCANGTDALILSLKALDIKDGDEVITVSHSFFATSEAIALVGAKPVFCDIQESDFNIDTKYIEKLITHKTKAIIPVHLYGQLCDIQRVVEIAKKYKLYVIEDCAQAIGAKYNNKFAGTFGDIGTFSFFPTKNLGAFGDAGAIVTDNAEIVEKLRYLRAHGSLKRYHHKFIGLNSRLDEVQAAILRIKLKYLEEWNQKRGKAAAYYNQLLKDVKGVIAPATKPNFDHTFHQYTIRTEQRDLLCEKLNSYGVEAIIYYPIPIHLQEAFSYLRYKKGDLPVTEKICSEIISLPMYPEITNDTQKYVVDLIKQIVTGTE